MKLNDARKVANATLRTALDEASLSRIYRHFSGGGFAIISANRHEYDDAGNAARYTALKAAVRAAGYGFVPLVGVWAEVGQPPQEEPSLFIPVGRGSPEELRDLVRRLGAKYDQEAVVFSWPGGKVELIEPAAGKVIMTFKTFRPAALGIAYSRLRRGRGTFMFEGWQFATPPRSFMEAVRRQGEGEAAFV